MKSCIVRLDIGGWHMKSLRRIIVVVSAFVFLPALVAAQEHLRTPENLRAYVNTNESAVTVLWDSQLGVPGVDGVGYLVAVAFVGDGDLDDVRMVFSILSGVGFQVRDVPPGTYYLRAYTWGRGVNNVSAPSGEIKVVVPPPCLPPEVPRYAWSEVHYSKKVHLEWLASEGASYYEVSAVGPQGQQYSFGNVQGNYLDVDTTNVPGSTGKWNVAVFAENICGTSDGTAFEVWVP